MLGRMHDEEPTFLLQERRIGLYNTYGTIANTITTCSWFARQNKRFFFSLFSLHAMHIQHSESGIICGTFHINIYPTVDVLLCVHEVKASRALVCAAVGPRLTRGSARSLHLSKCRIKGRVQMRVQGLWW